jgi:hypothetical protein
VQFPTIRTCSGFPAAWHVGASLLDVCLCVAGFHHRPHKIVGELAQHGVDHAVVAVFDSVGRFGSEHFTVTADIDARSSLDSRAYVWVYLAATWHCGGAKPCFLIQARLAAALVGMTF